MMFSQVVTIARQSVLWPVFCVRVGLIPVLILEDSGPLQLERHESKLGSRELAADG